MLVDSVISKMNENTIEVILNQFPHAIFYYFKPPVSLQKSGVGCTRFALNTIFSLQDIDGNQLYNELNNYFDIHRGSDSNSNNQIRLIDFNNLPSSLYKILRPIQNIEAIKIFPKAILEKKIKKSKAILDIEDKEISFVNFFKNQIKFKKNKLQNIFFDHKIESYREQIREFINNRSEEEVRHLIQHCKGEDILKTLIQPPKKYALLPRKDMEVITDEVIIELLLNYEFDNFIQNFSKLTHDIDEIQISGKNLITFIENEHDLFLLNFFLNLYLTSSIHSYKNTLLLAMKNNCPLLIDLIQQKNKTLAQEAMDILSLEESEVVAEYRLNQAKIWAEVNGFEFKQFK